MSVPWIAATEIARENENTRVFRFADELADDLLIRWSAPVQMRLQVNTDGTYDLVCRTVDLRTLADAPAFPS